MPQRLKQVVVVYSLQARQVHEFPLSVPLFSNVLAALVACESLASFPINVLSESDEWTCGVWGKPVTQDYVLREGDRLELYRSLKVDPKVARRERFQQQGTRAAGLFATRRKGAKPGY